VQGQVVTARNQAVKDDVFLYAAQTVALAHGRASVRAQVVSGAIAAEVMEYPIAVDLPGRAASTRNVAPIPFLRSKLHAVRTCHNRNVKLLVGKKLSYITVPPHSFFNLCIAMNPT
jgi:hypothetical protein